MTPYEAMYGKQPPSPITYLPSMSKVQEVETLLQNCEWTLVALKDNLARAQIHMKQQAY